MLPVYQCLTNKHEISSQSPKHVKAFKGPGRGIKRLCFQIKTIVQVGGTPPNTEKVSGFLETGLWWE